MKAAFKAGDTAIIGVTGEFVEIVAVSGDYALVRSARGQWTYKVDQLSAPDPIVCLT